MSGMYLDGKRVGTLISLSIQDANGDFIEVASTKRRKSMIVCSPVPGRDGVEYVPDWYGLTHFG